jgi:hypothetical protein
MGTETTTAMISQPRLDATAKGAHSAKPGRPVRVDHYLSRVGSNATLMTVSTFQADDGSLHIRRRFGAWPGL